MADPSPPADTFPALLRQNAERCGDLRAIVTADASITHGALDAHSRARAARLVAREIV